MFFKKDSKKTLPVVPESPPAEDSLPPAPDVPAGDAVAAPRTPPRFVPTLTEVVGEQAAPADGAPAGPRLGALPEPLVQQVLQAIGPTLDAQISEAIGRVLHEQMLGLNARVQREVAEVVRQAVLSALSRPAQD
ncbi:hypothetical protein EII20_02345 [Comamonadaceae bacterium OH2545_COT-014]|nr:hypothetical protein EII20_02345 [Comamonadaceae bacterium OH2545_COT-014]